MSTVMVAQGVEGATLTVTSDRAIIQRAGLFARLRQGAHTETPIADITGVHYEEPQGPGFRGFFQLLVGGEGPTTWLGANQHPRTLYFKSSQSEEFRRIHDYLTQLLGEIPAASLPKIAAAVGLDSYGNPVPIQLSPAEGDKILGDLAAPMLEERVILMLTSNPRVRRANGNDQPPLDLDIEEREVREALRESPHGRRFRLETRPAQVVANLTREFLETTPTVVHFSGHGLVAGLIMEDEDRRPVLVNPEALARLAQVKFIARNLRVIVLNACLTVTQAEFLSQYVDAVIGTTDEINDEAAATFARQLYGGLGYGLNLEDAVDAAVAQVAATSSRDASLIHLAIRPGVDPGRMSPLNQSP